MNTKEIREARRLSRHAKLGVCIGCGEEPAPKHSYGRLCRERLRSGCENLEMFNLLSTREARAAKGPGFNPPFVQYTTRRAK